MKMAIRSVRRTLLRASKPPQSSSSSIRPTQIFSLSSHSPEPSTSSNSPHFPRPNSSCNRIFCRRLSSLSEESLGPAAIDYRSKLEEDEYQRLANSTIHDLLEKLEEYGDSVEIDGFDVDYGNEVLTLKLGSLGTYVINKQTPNRQIWMSSPVSGPSRFDWDQDARSWVYRRTKQDLIKVLETELEKLYTQEQEELIHLMGSANESFIRVKRNEKNVLKW
ncbi:frataxin mitochondrial [Phtheirospermum japonicum]|uniref:ferroxidase n=1 Tax=Phtheirospermum japonicum TaxID=374723 RepID=A0A830C3X3_9LAMI|nr:frataxin mitochondrial [Phtheirospermum japonicum]